MEKVIKESPLKERTLTIAITATIENPGTVNPSIAIHEAFRALAGINWVHGTQHLQQTKCESPRVSCIATWDFLDKEAE
jgi:hypothetical protein